MSAVSLDSGTLELARRALTYTAEGQQRWRLRIDDLRLIAEYTNEDGPGLDDYFYVFAAGHPCSLYEAPMYAESGILEKIGAELGIDLQTGLANSTTFNSRIIWPPPLADRPFWSYSGRRREPGVWNWVKARVVPLVDSELTEEVRAYLGAEPD